MGGDFNPMQYIRAINSPCTATADGRNRSWERWGRKAQLTNATVLEYVLAGTTVRHSLARDSSRHSQPVSLASLLMTGYSTGYPGFFVTLTQIPPLFFVFGTMPSILGE